MDSAGATPGWRTRGTSVLRSPCTSLAYGGAFAPGEALEKVVIRISNGETYRAGNIWGMESKIFEIVLGIKT